jgi:hypothetical protein
MPMWMEEELLKANKFMYHLSSERVMTSFSQLGGVARGVLGLPSWAHTVDPLHELHDAIQAVTLDEV